MDAGDKLLGGDVLEQEPACTNPERVVDVLVHVEGGQHHDLRIGTVVTEQAASRLDPVDVGHADVHQHDVRPQAPRLRHRLSPVRRLADHLDVLFSLEDHAEAGADERLVVDDQHAKAHAGTTGSLARKR